MDLGFFVFFFFWLFVGAGGQGGILYRLINESRTKYVTVCINIMQLSCIKKHIMLLLYGLMVAKRVYNAICDGS